MKEIKLLIVLVATLGVITVIIALIFIVDKNRQAEIERRARKVEAQRVERLIGQCHDYVHKAYLETWNESCKRLGKSNNCALPSRMANGYKKNLGFREQRCIEKYK